MKKKTREKTLYFVPKMETKAFVESRQTQIKNVEINPIQKVWFIGKS